MYVKMKEININIEGFNENGICVGCLNYNRKMYRQEDVKYNIKACLQLLAHIYFPDGIDVQVCWECYADIRNVYRFQAQIVKSYKYLSEYSQKQTFLISPTDLSQYATQRLTSNYFLESNDSTIICQQINGETSSKAIKVEPEDTNLSCRNDDALREEEIYVPLQKTELQDGLKIENDIEGINYSDGEDLFPEQDDVTLKSKKVIKWPQLTLDINLLKQSSGAVRSRAPINRPKMPRAQTTRKKGTRHDRIKEGLALIRNGESIRTASKRAEVPFVTLRRYYWKTKDIPLEKLLPSQLTPNYAVNKVFTLDQEIALKNYFTRCGLQTTKEYLKVAYQCAKMKNMKMPASWQENEMAGQDWWNSFRRRHDITLNKPETCSSAGAAIHKSSVVKFYETFQSTATNPRRDPRGGDASMPDTEYIPERDDIENDIDYSEELDLVREQDNITSEPQDVPQLSSDTGQDGITAESLDDQIQLARPARPRAQTTRKRGTPRDRIKQGLLLIRNGESVQAASRIAEVPFFTLRRYYRKIKGTLEQLPPSQLTPNYPANKVFTSEQEITLVNYFSRCSLQTAKEYRKVAYQCAKMNNLKMPVSWQKKQTAGQDWWNSFRRRHGITLNKSETCRSGAAAFRKSSVDKFYDNLAELLSRSPDFADGTRIYNLGEISTPIVRRSQDVIASSDQESIGKEISEDIETITTCCIMSATGNCLPPVMIFPRIKFKDGITKNTPPDTLELATPNGRMNATIFPKAMEHFIKHTSASKENPCILIMDDRESHLSLEALQLATNSGVHIVTLPPHTSAKLQPLEVGIYGLFNSSYNAAMDSWTLRNPGKSVTIDDLGEIVGSAFQKAMTPRNIADSFAKCGIFPLNRHVFTVEDFQPTATIPCRRDLRCEGASIPDAECVLEHGEVDLLLEPNSILPESEVIIKLNSDIGQDSITAESSDNNIKLSQQSNGEITSRAAATRPAMQRAQTTRKKGTPHAKIKEGLSLIRNGESIRTASKRADVPIITLRRYYWKTKDIPLEELLPSQLTPNYAVNKVFTPKQEIALKNYFTRCALQTTKEYRKVAYQCAKMKNLRMPASWRENQMAGQDWWNSFRRRHDITLKKPETCSSATAFHKTHVDK